MPTKSTFIPLNKIMGYLAQTCICIKFAQDADLKEKMQQIAQEEIQKYPQVINARKLIDLDNDVIKRFKQAGIYYK